MHEFILNNINYITASLSIILCYAVYRLVKVIIMHACIIYKNHRLSNVNKHHDTIKIKYKEWLRELNKDLDAYPTEIKTIQHVVNIISHDIYKYMITYELKKFINKTPEHVPDDVLNLINDVMATTKENVKINYEILKSEPIYKTHPDYLYDNIKNCLEKKIGTTKYDINGLLEEFIKK